MDNYESMTKKELQAELDKRGIEITEGSGSNGYVLKQDIIDALKNHDDVYSTRRVASFTSKAQVVDVDPTPATGKKV
jgi:hypothetical protein